jgi:hypothetical protein
MTKQNTVHGILILLMLTAFIGPALADGISGLYIGGSAGLAKIEYDNSVYQTLLQNEVAGIWNPGFYVRKAARPENGVVGECWLYGVALCGNRCVIPTLGRTV